jgi:hypothetical protein
MKKVHIFICLLIAVALPVFASTSMFSHTYILPNPLWIGTENISVNLSVSDNVLSVPDNPIVSKGNPVSKLDIYDQYTLSATISKVEQWGGYAYGISYWVNTGTRIDVLFDYSNNGSYTIKLPANATLKIQLYTINVLVYVAMGDDYIFSTHVDNSGPTFTFTPAPGNYSSNQSIKGTPKDLGVGFDAAAVRSYTIRPRDTSITPTIGSGDTAPLTVEGVYDVDFTGRDLLGNVGTSTESYTIDYGPPILAAVTMSAQGRPDGALNFNLQFTLKDPGAGINRSTLTVMLSQQGGSTWTYSQSGLTLTGTDGELTVSIPAITVPRDARLGLHVIVSDKLGKKLDSNDTLYSIVLPPRPASTTIVASGVSATLSQPAADFSRTPIYRIPIRLDKLKSEFISPGVSRYILRRHVRSPLDVSEVAADMTPAEFCERLVDGDGYSIYTDELNGARYAHQTITYELETIFSVDGAEISASTGMALMPNIEAWRVRLLSNGALLQNYLSGQVVFDEIRVKTFQGMVFEIGADPEGDALSMRLEYLGPGGLSGTSPQNDWTQQIMLDQAIPGAADGMYKYRFVVSESGNPNLQYGPWGSIKQSVNSSVINTPEQWNTDQILSGSIVILSGGSLRIGEGVHVTAVDIGERTPEGRPIPGGSPSITVRDGGSLELLPGSAIRPTGWNPDVKPSEGWNYWGGIYADTGGTVSITSATICGAIRGVIALQDSSVAISDSRIVQCRTGVHALGLRANPVIDATFFIECERYGIKEDSGASPIVTDCVFSGNSFAYYDKDLLAIDAEEINSLSPENHGNVASEVTP